MNEASKPTAGFSGDTEILTRGQSWIRFDRLTASNYREGSDA